MIKRSILYLLCLYDIYLYLPDALDLFKINFYPPDPDILTYFDALMLAFGGIVTGLLLIKTGGRFNKYLGIVMIFSKCDTNALVYLAGNTVMYGGDTEHADSVRDSSGYQPVVKACAV